MIGVVLDVESVLKRLESLSYGKHGNRFGGKYRSANLQVNHETQWIISSSSKVALQSIIDELFNKMEPGKTQEMFRLFVHGIQSTPEIQTVKILQSLNPKSQQNHNLMLNQMFSMSFLEWKC